MSNACDVVINFCRRHKNPDQKIGGIKVKGITRFTDCINNVIGGFSGYKNTLRDKKQATKSILWAMYNPETNQQGTQCVSYTQFVQDLKQFNITGATSFEHLVKFAYACAQESSGLDIFPEPVVVHLLDQAEEMEFLGHIDASELESDSRVRVSVIVKLQEGLCHAVGFWPCGCGVHSDDNPGCNFCIGDTKDDLGRAKVKCSQHLVVPYTYGKCALVFDARQRHMTKAVNLSTATHCIKMGFFFATRTSMVEASGKRSKNEQ